MRRWLVGAAGVLAFAPDFADTAAVEPPAADRAAIERAWMHQFTDDLALCRLDDGRKIVGRIFYRHP